MFLSRSDEETTANRKLAKELVDKWVSNTELRDYICGHNVMLCQYFLFCGYEWRKIGSI